MKLRKQIISISQRSIIYVARLSAMVKIRLMKEVDDVNLPKINNCLTDLQKCERITLKIFPRTRNELNNFTITKLLKY